MRSIASIQKVISIGVVASLVTLCVSWMVHGGMMAQIGEVTGGNVQTVEQCINNETGASIEPSTEEAFVRKGLIEEKLDEMTITKEMCEEIIDRTPRGTPVELALTAANLIQELDIIQKSMEAAARQDDANSDYLAEEINVELAASFQRSGGINDGVIGGVEFASAAHDQYHYGGADGAPESPRRRTRTTNHDQYHHDGANGAGGWDANGDGTVDARDYEIAVASSFAAAQGARRSENSGATLGETQAKARADAERLGASPKVAAAGGTCAAEVAMLDGTVEEASPGWVTVNRPPKEMGWRDSETIKLTITPKVLAPIEHLETISKTP